MRKIFAPLLVLLLSFNQLTASFAAPIKAGSKCSSHYTVSKVGGKTFICTLHNSKLTWQPSVEEMEKKIWADLQLQRASLPDASALLDIHLSPTVNKDIAKTLTTSVSQAAKLWQPQYLPDKPLTTFFFSEKDRDWFISEMKSSGVYSEHQLANFDDEVKRNGNRANWAGVTGEGGRIWMLYMIGSGKSAPDNNDWQVAAHEYTHLAQFAIAKESNQTMTCWQVEGGAAFYGLFLGAKDAAQVATFTKERNNDGGFLGFPGLTKLQKPNFEKYLDQFGPNYDNTKCGPNGAYQIGGIANEYLYTLKGHRGLIEMLQKTAENKDFAVAIEQVYGKPWPVIRKGIASYINLVIAQSV